MSNYKEFLAMVSTEFHRYVMENEALGEKLPPNALVVFEIEGEDEFNRWHKKTSLGNREPDQPLVIVKVKRWRQHSSIEELHLSTATGELKATASAISPAQPILFGAKAYLPEDARAVDKLIRIGEKYPTEFKTGSAPIVGRIFAFDNVTGVRILMG